MDYGLSTRRAFVANPGGPIGAACVRALQSEGVEIVESVDVDRPGALADVDIVVAEAGELPAVPLLEVATIEPLHEAWNAVVDGVEIYRSALTGMTERRWGRFVWVGSAASRSLDVAVGASDEHGAMVTLAMRAAGKVLAAEAGPFSVTANSVIHGGNATPDDVAATVTFLCSEGAGYITGVTIAVDGGAGTAMF